MTQKEKINSLLRRLDEQKEAISRLKTRLNSLERRNRVIEDEAKSLRIRANKRIDD